MKLNIPDQIRRIFPFQAIIYLLSTIVFYLLGSGLARYLGQIIDWATFFLGLGYAVLILFSGFLLRAYFDPVKADSQKPQDFSYRSEEMAKRQNLTAGLATLAVSCVLIYLLVIRNGIVISEVIFLFLLFALMFLFAVPPFKLAARGYGELVMVIWIVDLVTAMAFIIQGSEIHKLIPILTFPLTALFLAMMISTTLQAYLKDMISGQKTLDIMLGWKLGMDLHNWLILAAYLMIAAASLFGLPWNITWPLLLPVPFFLFSVYEMMRIKSGTKPRWVLLTLSGYAGIGTMLYVLLFTLWIK